MYLYLMVPML